MAEESAAPEAPQEAAAPETPAETNGSPPAEQAKPQRTLEEVEAELAKTRREAANYRVKLKEVEPIAKAAQEAEEAKKDRIQKAEERAQAAEAREQATLADFAKMELIVQYHLEPEDGELLGSGTREEMDARAQLVAAKNAAAAKATPPPTNQPVEGLRPGASPGPAREPDDSYPAAWIPNHLRGNDDSRSQYGQ